MMNTMQESTARLLAAKRLLGSGYTLRSGPGLCLDDGWRFAVRREDEADAPYRLGEMALMLWVHPQMAKYR